MSKPSPRPWKTIGETGFICGPDGNPLHPNRNPNAAHIVKCVNMHDELVIALRAFVINKSYYKPEEPFIGAFDKLVSLSEKLIAKAGEEWGNYE